jgi:hypothetical protein
MKRILYFLIFLLVVACKDDDSFSASSSLKLSFTVDTLKLDTVFSRTPSSTYSFWVHNRNNDGIRLQSIRLKRGNQSGYRVNVDGIYLDNGNGAQTNNVEIRKKDSILVFVELTAPEVYRETPTLVEDDLLFLLESGAEQKVLLQAWAWDAIKLYSPVIGEDSVIDSRVPYIIYGDMTVKEGVTLTIRNTSFYFHEGSGLEVYGRLNTENCLMRGDRLDRMFSYLPYDRICGQWKGIHLYTSSTENILIDTEIRNPEYGIICDSAAIGDTYRLRMLRCVVHNCKGVGVELNKAYALLENCQLTNTLGDCLSISGGNAEIQYCTIAQFYPFSANRGAALYLTNQYSSLERFICEGSIITGYEEDVVMGSQKGDDTAFNYSFKNCLLRTPMVDDAKHYSDIIWESINDSIQGTKHFVTIDEENLYYDFHLVPKSPAVGLGCY